MVKIDQTKFEGREGNCLAASLATLLQLPLVEIPEFEDMRDDVWGLAFIGFLVTRGFWFSGYLPISEYPEGVRGLNGYYMVSGKTERKTVFTFDKGKSREGAHAVIYKDGKLFHDPYPTRAGLIKPEFIMDISKLIITASTAKEYITDVAVINA